MDLIGIELADIYTTSYLGWTHDYRNRRCVK